MTNNTTLKNGLSLTDSRVISISAIAEVELIEAVELLTDGDWLCLTDTEADELAKEMILDSVWAFNTDFLASHSDVNIKVFEQLRELCEDSNDAILSLIKDVDHFVNDAIACDGRGHFISSWDGEEHEITIDNIDFFCFRLN